MSKWDDRYEEYKNLWRRNGATKSKRELEQIRKGLSYHHDTFFHEVAPDELSDGDRVMALRDVIMEFEKS